MAFVWASRGRRSHAVTTQAAEAVLTVWRGSKCGCYTVGLVADVGVVWGLSSLLRSFRSTVQSVLDLQVIAHSYAGNVMRLNDLSPPSKLDLPRETLPTRS